MFVRDPYARDVILRSSLTFVHHDQRFRMLRIIKRSRLGSRGSPYEKREFTW